MSLLILQSIAAKRSSRGVSLIELLVSLVIGLLLVAGAASVYLQSRDTYRTSETAARLQEVARYALDTIEPDVRMSGYWGLTNTAAFIFNGAPAAQAEEAVADDIERDCGNNWIVDVAQFIDARDQTLDATTGSYNLACAGNVPEGVSGPTGPATWSDVLIIRRASSDMRAATSGRVQIQTTRTGARIFKDGTIPADVAAMSETRDLLVHAYYISQRGNGANGLPQFQLRRQTLQPAGSDMEAGATPEINDIEIVSGVEDLQVQFGVDTGTDGNVDRYVNPGAVPANARIASVRIWLRVVADDREPGFSDTTNYTYANSTTPATATDGRRRVLISKTIQIRNSRA
jgi:type IV pilus assembly protein PilW